MNRHGILVGSVVLALLLAGSGTGLGLASPDGPANHGTRYGASDLTYAVVQGDSCVEVSPLGGGRRTVESFYSYRNSETSAPSDSFTAYSSFGTVGMQENQVSNVFLYEDPRGVSLVFVHDEHGIRSPSEAPHGGAITFEFRGLPAGEWVVRDDFYGGGEQNDRWASHGSPGDSYTVDWIWRDGRTDGGAYRGLERLGPGDAVQIRPAFDRRAGLWDEDLDDRTDVMERWQLLDGSGRHVALSKTEPITISPGPCRPVTLETRGMFEFHLAVDDDQPVGQVTRYVPPSRAGDVTGVRLSRVRLQLRDGDPRFAVDATVHPTRPASLPAVDGVTDDRQYVTLGARDLDAGVESFAVQFDVDRSFYEDRDLGPGRVVVHQYRDGRWHELPTTLAFETRDAVVFEATAPAVAPLAVATREPDVHVAVEAVGPDLVRGDEAVVRATVENRGLVRDRVPLAFTVQGRVVERRNVSVPAGGSQTVQFARQINQTGRWRLGVNGETVEIRVGPPRPELGVVDLAVRPSSIPAGGQVAVVATVRNDGGAAGPVPVPLSAFGTTVATKQVDLAPGETAEVTFVRAIEAPGTYSFAVGNRTAQVTVTGAGGPATTDRGTDLGDAGVPAIVLGIIFLLIGLTGAVLLWR